MPVSKLETQITTILLKAGVPVNRIDQCIEWAFGKGAWYTSPSEWGGRWNKLHPGAFRAGKKDKFVEFIYVVGFYYATFQKTGEYPSRN